jgi:hypothetical protein
MAYYEDDALPFLFSLLGRGYITKEEQLELNLIQHTIISIYNEGTRSRSFGIVCYSLDQLTDEILFSDDISESNSFALSNYLTMFKRLDLGFWKKRRLRQELETFKDKFESRNYNKSNDKTKKVVSALLETTIKELQ